MSKIEIFTFGFLTLRKVNGAYRVHLAIQQQKDVVCKLFAFLCLVFQGAPPIPYVQADSLNLSHSNLRSTTILLSMPAVTGLVKVTPFEE